MEAFNRLGQAFDELFTAIWERIAGAMQWVLEHPIVMVAYVLFVLILMAFDLLTR